jgi:hypothetical protein
MAKMTPKSKAKPAHKPAHKLAHKTPVKTETKHTSKSVKKDQKAGKPSHGAKPAEKAHAAKSDKDKNLKSKKHEHEEELKQAKAKVLAKAPVVKKDEKSKKPKKAKAGKGASKEEFDLGDDLVGDEDLGAEEIPDLAEFEEIEIEVEEVEDLRGELSAEGPKAPDEEIILTDAEGRRYCRVRDCDQIASVEGYCRYHYLLLWKRIQVRRKILVDGKLERYVEELTARYPDKFLEMIRKDLRTEKDFLAAIAELEIDESAVDSEFEDESASFIEEVRGISEGSPSMSDDEEF